MIGRNIVVIGASAGGIEALTTIVEALPAELNGSVFIVLHIGAALSRLPEILGRNSRLPIANAIDGEAIRVGRVYVAPPDLHMILESGRIRLVRGPKENFTRPAIDPLFHSAAIEFGARVVGIVLTGYQDDGSAGLIAIKNRGGITIVQDPQEAFAPSMPQSALACVQADHCCSVADMPRLIESYDPPNMVLPPVPIQLEVEHRLTAMQAFLAEEEELERLGSPSSLTCPECKGVLYELHDDRLLRFRCRTGHAMSAQALLPHLSSSRESAIWSAIRTLDEEAMLIRQLSARKSATSGGVEHPNGDGANALVQLAEQLRTTMRDPN